MKALTTVNILVALFLFYSVYLFFVEDNAQLQKFSGLAVVALLLFILMLGVSQKAKLTLFEKLYPKGKTWCQVYAKTTFFYTLRNKFQDLHGKSTNRIKDIQPAGILILIHKKWIKEKYEYDSEVGNLLDDFVRKYILLILLLIIIIFNFTLVF